METWKIRVVVHRPITCTCMYLKIVVLLSSYARLVIPKIVHLACVFGKENGIVVMAS